MIPKNFKEVRLKIEKDERISEIIAELKKPSKAGDHQKERSIQAPLLKNKLKVGERFIQYCGDHLEVQEAEKILQYLCESLDLEKAIEEIGKNIATGEKFNEIKLQIESDEIIQNAIVELKQMQTNQEGEDDDDIQVILEQMKIKIWQKVSKILPQDQEILTNVRQRVLEDLDLESAIAHLEENLAPKAFNPLKAMLESDTELRNLIDDTRNLNENGAAMIKHKQLEGQIVRLLNKYKPQIDDEQKWTEVQEDLKKNFSLKQSLSIIQELMPPNKYKKLVEQVTGDPELVKTIEDLRALKIQGDDDNKEEQLKRALIQYFIQLLELKSIDKGILKEAAIVLGNSLKIEDALELLRNNIPPTKFKALDIENIVMNDETLKKMLIEIESEKKKMSSADKVLQLILDFVVGQISLNDGRISADKIKKIKGKISELLSAKHSIQGLFDDIVKFINESKFGLPVDKIENMKKEALKSPSMTNINNYLVTKEVIRNLFETCQICDDQLATDVSSQFYETQNLENALAPVKSKYPGSFYDRLLELGSKNEDLERIAFEGLEQAPDSFMKKDYIKKARDLIQGINSHKVKYTLVIDLLQHIYKNGLHDGIDLDKYQKEDRTIMEEILKKIDKDPLRLEIDEIKVREELEKDMKEVVGDLKPELLTQIVEEILKKGLMSALMEEADNHLNKKLVKECLNKIVPYLQTKEIYKATKLYEKDLATWSVKADSLFSKLTDKVQNKEDLETVGEVREYLKIGSLDREDIKEIKWVLTRIGQENKYSDIKELTKKIFERDYATMITFKKLESSGEEREVEDLVKCQLKFKFQFKDLENYINEIICKDFERGEDLYKEQAAKYPELAKPELLNYEEYLKKDKQILGVLIELENAKRLYKKDKNQKILDDVNKRLIPKLFGMNKDLYKMWITKNKSKDFPVKDYEISSNEYALHPMESCNKAKKIASSMKLPDIHLKTFNVVTFRSSQEEQDLMIKNWIHNIEDPEKFEELLPIYFNLLKRGEDWKIFVEKVSANILDEKMNGKFGFFQRKFLFYLLLVSGDKELKARLLQLYGNYNPIPVTYPKWPIDPVTGVIQANINNQALEYEFNELIYYTIQPSLGILSIGLGNKASLPIGKSEILNKVFKKNFATLESSPFHVNTIDIDFDSSFRPYRQFCIADAHGNFPLNQLPYFLALFRILIVHVHAEDLSQDRIRAELETLCRTVSSGNQNNHMVVLIRDDSLDEGYYEKDEKILKKKFPQLEPVFKLPDQSTSIASLRSIVDLNSNEQSVVNQKLQTTILGAVKLYKDEITVTKETFLEHLLKNLKNENQHDIFQVDNTLRAFLGEMKKYVNNFFDEKVFPCRNYLSELRKVQKILRTAKTDAELNQAKITHAKLEEKLKSVKSTTLMKLFAEILRGENSYLVVMELSREIKDIISANIKKLLKERDELLDEIKPKASNQDDPSNTVDAQRLKQNENQKKLKQKNEEIDQRSLSIEVIWRELMALYNYNKQEVIDTLDINPVEKIKEFLDKGEPFELIDGDNLQFNENLLKELFSKLKGKMCTTCVLGPQSSGKSTLLNYLFGCQFVSSVGRCTRGIYLSILKINNNPNYEYLMILDTEGLQGVEKNDDEFDRKITLFCLAVSQIIIVNVKGDLHLPMKSLLEICTLSLHGLDKSKIDCPTIYFVFNQNPPTKDKTPFMNQISKMMNEIIDANPEAKSVAQILVPSEQTLHALGFAFQTSKEEKNDNKNIWQDWPYMQPQSSFANECATLSQIMYKTMEDRFIKASESQKVFAQFKEWSRIANDIWKTIDMYPNLLEFPAIRHMKQDRELRDHGNRLLEAKKHRLNGEMVIEDKIKSSAGPKKAMIMDNNHNLQIQIIVDHYNTIKKEINDELMKIRVEEKYDYDLTIKHEKHIVSRIEAYEQEAILLFKRNALQIMLEVSKNQGLQEVTGEISTYQLDPEVSGSKEAAEKKFEELWSKNIGQGLTTLLNEDNHDKTLWTTISSVYNKEEALPDLGTAVTMELQSKINKDPQSKLDEKEELNPLIDHMINMFKQDFGVKHEEKNDIFLKNILTRYRQRSTYFLFETMLKQTAIIKYFDPTLIINDPNVWSKWKNDVDLSFYQFNGISSKEDSFYEKIKSLLSAFVQLGYSPIEKVIAVIDSHPPQIEIRKLFGGYKEYSQVKDLPSLFEKKMTPSFESKSDIPQSKYWKIEILNQEIPGITTEQSDPEIAEFEKEHPDYCVVKKAGFRFDPSDHTSATGLKYCVDPFDKSIPAATALGELREMILNKTNWTNLLRDIYENIIKEINANGDFVAKDLSGKGSISNIEDEESSYRDISSFSVHLVKNVVKKVEQKIDEYNKEILRCAHKLDMAITGKIHFFALLITWKTLCFASRKRLMKPVEQIIKEKEKWKNYFVSSVNNNSHEKSASFAERIIVGYLLKRKPKIIEDGIKPKAVQTMEAIKDEFTVASLQKRLDDRFLLSKNSEEVVKYVLEQVKFYEEDFENVLWPKYYTPLLDELKNMFKEDVNKEIGLVLGSVKSLNNFFKTYHQKEMGPAPLEVFEIKNTQESPFDFNNLNNEQAKVDLLPICNRAQFALFNDFFNSQIDENWKYKEGQYTLTVKGLNGVLKSELKVDFGKEANLSENENEISYLTVFLNRFEQTLNQEMEKIHNEQLEWGHPDVGLDKLYQEYKNSSVGCTESCPTCGRKCDRFGHKHTHGCDSGHQIRGMFGVTRGGYLSCRTCDEIKPESEIEVPGAGSMKWEEFVSKKCPTWDFTQVDKAKTQENILKYRECWKNHGNAFANHFTKIYGQKVLSGYAQESEAYHFILAMDGSGTMCGPPWENAKKGASNFLSKLKQYEDSVSEIAISIIVFNSKAQTHASYENLNVNLDETLIYPGGGTMFGPPLQNALTLIKDEKGLKFHRHIILFYTDGAATYPAKVIKEIQDFGDKSKISFYALSEEDNPTTLKKIVDDFKQFGIAELKSSITPDKLVKELPEVLNSVFHKVY